jgi:hypothetical protein
MLRLQPAAVRPDERGLRLPELAGRYAANPKPIQRTDWTTIGSDDDNHVASDSATGMGANSTKVIDTTDSNIEHPDFLDATRAVNDASVIYRQPGGDWFAWNWWPVRWTQQSLFSNDL